LAFKASGGVHALRVGSALARTGSAFINVLAGAVGEKVPRGADALVHLIILGASCVGAAHGWIEVALNALVVIPD
jgi:hypothetical protein